MDKLFEIFPNSFPNAGKKKPRGLSPAGLATCLIRPEIVSDGSSGSVCSGMRVANPNSSATCAKIFLALTKSLILYGPLRAGSEFLPLPKFF